MDKQEKGQVSLESLAWTKWKEEMMEEELPDDDASTIEDMFSLRSIVTINDNY